ncbi:MAG: arsenite methyltransferase [Candidatus Thorarchaeota archaeon]|nr:MAG: arsenite methyltransferase [Candidatus Thorarchaeota archaeon]
MSSEEIKGEVRKAYSRVAGRKAEEQSDRQASGCCGPETTSSCGPSSSLLDSMGYDTEGLPSSATESFAGCGNPVALASLRAGETVLDLGSGAGLDVFMAARQVGETGRVIGIDMTPAMLEKARMNVEKIGLTNVEFREGDIENLPVDDDSIDVIISNCVINLAPDKAKVFRESFRVLRPGGRLMVSDIVLEVGLPTGFRDEIATYTGCIGGAISEDEYLQHIRDAGFENVEVVSKAGFGYASSAKIAAYKPN